MTFLEKRSKAEDEKKFITTSSSVNSDKNRVTLLGASVAPDLPGEP